MMTTSSTTRGVGHGSAILPDRPGLVARFWEGVQKGHLPLQRCKRCGHHWHPPADVCDACRSFDIEWTAATGNGTLFSYTVVHHATHPVVQGWVPYTLMLVQLEEGPRILATIEPDNAQALPVGARLGLDFRRVHPDLQIPVFRLLPDPGRTE
jgi:uncharacterized OB-fold protein